jgi:hypothetical protein
MPARRTRGLSADLFATAAAPKVPPPEAPLVAPQVEHDPAPQPSPVRHVLPKDLPGALARLSDPELDILLVAAIDEARRRGRLPSNMAAKSRDADQTSHDATQAKSRVPHVAPPSWQSNADDVSSSLTLGQLRAVRAAFKAGVKPSVIARQFGVSQSDVRKVLAADARDHKSGR